MRRLELSLLLFAVAIPVGVACAAEPGPASQDAGFTATVRPFIRQYCVECHGGDEPEADLDLERYATVAEAAKDSGHWGVIIERLEAGEMPPRKAKGRPTEASRQAMVAWFKAAREDDARRNAGDPGVVLARRLSNAEYDNSVRDLTGVDLRPAREFPVDPANTAGFDNSGETLVMSPTLLNKCLQAAHEVADHMFLTPDGFAFSPTVMLAESDRDQYCVKQIIALYRRQNIDYAEYFQAAWRYKHRAALGRPGATLAEVAADAKVSAKYLATVWSMLEEEKEEVGPLARLQSLWRQLPAGDQGDAARRGCEQMKQFVVQFRRKVEPRFLNLATAGRGGNGQGGGSTVLIMWKNVQYATHRMKFDAGQLQVEGEPMPAPLVVSKEPNASGEFGPGRTVPVINAPGDPDLVVPAGQRAKYEAAFARFCRVFPDRFYMDQRGRNYFDTKKDRGRYLSTGFHSQMGYFRDDQPLYELVLDEKQQKELDDLWTLFDFMSRATERLYVESGAGNPRRGVRGAATQPVVAVTPGAIAASPTSEAMIKAAEERFLAGAGNPGAEEAGRYFYGLVNRTLRSMETARADAVPRHLEALQRFAARAYRRPLSSEENAELVQYYKAVRQKDGLDHEAALRESIVAILMSPDFSYRIDLLKTTAGVHPLTDYELASRLSYFLWSSMPDDELMAQASAGKLRDPKVIAAQARRMLKDPRVRALAVEFGGNWLEFRRFGGITTVDRDHFKAFSNELRDAMFEEPVRLLCDVIRNGRPVLDLLYGKDTFVNPVLAKHYGMPIPDGGDNDWVHVQDATPYQRGGLFPMAAFLTQNAPGLRTSPVKRGNWVVKDVLGERIPPPPPGVPAIPKDESALDLPLRQTLARHRNDPNCASCHDRIDSYGLVFEGFGPIGERRETDLAGRPLDTSAVFPGGGEGAGVPALLQHIRDRRQNDFVNNLCGKLVAYALGRSLIPSDDLLVRDMRQKLEADGYCFDSLIESVVTSKQFLNKRGHEELAERSQP